MGAPAVLSLYPKVPGIAKVSHKPMAANGGRSYVEVTPPPASYTHVCATDLYDATPRTLKSGSISNPPPFRQFGPPQALLPVDMDRPRPLHINRIFSQNEDQQVSATTSPRSNNSSSPSKYSDHMSRATVGGGRTSRSTDGSKNDVSAVKDLSTFLRTTGPPASDEVTTRATTPSKKTPTSQRAFRLFKRVPKFSPKSRSDTSARKEFTHIAKVTSAASFARDQIDGEYDASPSLRCETAAHCEQEHVPPGWKQAVSKAGKKYIALQVPESVLSEPTHELPDELAHRTSVADVPQEYEDSLPSELEDHERSSDAAYRASDLYQSDYRQSATRTASSLVVHQPETLSSAVYCPSPRLKALPMAKGDCYDTDKSVCCSPTPTISPQRSHNSSSPSPPPRSPLRRTRVSISKDVQNAKELNTQTALTLQDQKFAPPNELRSLPDETLAKGPLQRSRRRTAHDRTQLHINTNTNPDTLVPRTAKHDASFQPQASPPDEHGSVSISAISTSISNDWRQDPHAVQLERSTNGSSDNGYITVSESATHPTTIHELPGHSVMVKSHSSTMNGRVSAGPRKTRSGRSGSRNTELKSFSPRPRSVRQRSQANKRGQGYLTKTGSSSRARDNAPSQPPTRALPPTPHTLPKEQTRMHDIAGASDHKTNGSQTLSSSSYETIPDACANSRHGSPITSTDIVAELDALRKRNAWLEAALVAVLQANSISSSPPPRIGSFVH